MVCLGRDFEDHLVLRFCHGKGQFLLDEVAQSPQLWSLAF